MNESQGHCVAGLAVGGTNGDSGCRPCLFRVDGSAATTLKP